jgi:hypothetical protein
MKTESVRYDADGLQMIGHFAYDEKDSKKRPAVLVFPEAFGLGDHAKKRAERIAAELGYAAMACDLHGEQKVIGEIEQVMALLQPLRTEAAKVRARTVNALKALTARPQVDVSRVAAIGFCFGGTMTYELALTGANIRLRSVSIAGCRSHRRAMLSRSRPRFWRYSAPTIPRSQPSHAKPSARCSARAAWIGSSPFMAGLCTASPMKKRIGWGDPTSPATTPKQTPAPGNR